MAQHYIEVEVTNAWWEREKDELDSTYTDRAYVDRTSYGQAVWVLRFGPFVSLQSGEVGELRDALDLIMGDHIKSFKVTTKPF